MRTGGPQRYRGITSFIANYAGTVKPGATLTTRSGEGLDWGIHVYVDDEVLGIVALSPEANDTPEKLAEELPKLYGS